MRGFVVAMGVVLLGVVGASVLVHRSPPAAELQGAAADTSSVFEVDAFMHRTEAPPGQVRVRGVVSSVQADTGLMTLIDRSEWDACGVVTCAPLSLPVRWTGAMPKVKDGVEVLGHVETQQGKLVLVAEDLEPVSLISTQAAGR